MSKLIPLLLSSPIIGFCAILFTLGLVYGLLNGQIEIIFPEGGGIRIKNKENK